MFNRKKVKKNFFNSSHLIFIFLGSQQFQREYIEYLQEQNISLMEKVNLMKKNYENKIVSKVLNKQCHNVTFDEVYVSISSCFNHSSLLTVKNS